MSLTQINKAGLDEIALDHVFTVGASGTDHYTFQGEGLNGTVNDPTLYLTRGKTYRFEKGSAHPLRIQSTQGASGTAYNTGVTNNGGTGTVIIEVQHDAPDVLYYQCTSHAAMNGVLYITGALADGGVTTAKIADDAVTDAKLANSINAAIAANTAKTTNATHTGDVTGSTSLTIANNAVTTAKLADDAVTNSKIGNNAVEAAQLGTSAVITAKIANDAVTNAKIPDNEITLAKLVHGTSSNNGKFLRANNGADPTFETVNTDLVSDTSPQLGGNLDLNNRNIKGADSTSGNSNANRIKLGSSDDLQIYHDGSNSKIVNYFGRLHIENSGGIIRTNTNHGFFVQSADGNTTHAEIDNEGLKFNGDTAGANALDDYEEGTWNCSFQTNSGSFPTQSAVGRYTKIGRTVHIQGQVFWAASNGSGSGIIWMTLPFLNTSAARGGIAPGLISGLDFDSEHQLYVMPEINSYNMYWMQVKPNDPAGGHAHLTPSAFRNYASRGISFAGTYMV